MDINISVNVVAIACMCFASAILGATFPTLLYQLQNRLRLRSMVREVHIPARDFVADRSGVTALEYGIIAGVLGLVLLLIFKNMGGTMMALFNTIGRSV